MARSGDKSTVYQFEAKVLQDLSVTDYGLNFPSNGLSPTKPAEGIIVRPLSSDDFDKGGLVRTVQVLLQPMYCR